MFFITHETLLMLLICTIGHLSDPFSRFRIFTPFPLKSFLSFFLFSPGARICFDFFLWNILKDQKNRRPIQHQTNIQQKKNLFRCVLYPLNENLRVLILFYTSLKVEKNVSFNSEFRNSSRMAIWIIIDTHNIQNIQLNSLSEPIQHRSIDKLFCHESWWSMLNYTL